MNTFIVRSLNALKRLTIGVITSLTLLLIMVFITISALAGTILDREYVLDFLSSEDSYEVITEAIPTVVEYTDDSNQEIRLDTLIKESGATSFIEKHLDYTFYEDVTNKLVNGVFNWLEGASEKPTFSISVADSKEEFISIFTDAYMLRINQLPSCESQSFTPRDPFQFDCKPMNYSKQNLRAYLTENQNNPDFKSFMQSATINSDDLQLDQELQNIPQAFQFIKWIPVLLLVIIISFTYLVYLLYFDYRRASQNFGRSIVASVLFILAVSSVLVFSYDALTSRIIRNQENQVVLQEIWGQIGVVVIDFLQIIILLSGGFVLIGLLLNELGSQSLQRRFLDKQE